MEDVYDPMAGLLEVVMEERDQELAIPSENDAYDLPPIPTFDLHSEQYTYVPHRVVPTPPKPPPQKQQVTAPKPVKQVNPLNNVIVYDKPDTAINEICGPGEEELNYYSKIYNDLRTIEKERIHCTICDAHIGTACDALALAKKHMMLNVLICKNCFKFYGDGIFPTDESDNTEVYCRWCGQGGALVCCSFCPKVFCKKCVRRNYNNVYLKEIEKASEWACFCCAQRPLWPLRALCWGLLRYLQTFAGTEDKSSCCRKEKPPPKAKKTTSSPKPVAPSPKQVEKPKPGPVSHPMMILQPAALSQYSNNIQKRQTTQIKMGDTVISYPTRRSQKQKEPAAGKSQQSNAAKATPPARPPNKQIPSTMPEVRVDHGAADHTVVRLRMANDREQYLRVNIVGSCQRMPTFPAKLSFTLTSLQHSFRLNRLMYDKLKSLKDKMAQNQNLKKLEDEAQLIQSTLAKWKQLISEIENDLSRNLEIHRSEKPKNDGDVIDLSDDEHAVMAWKFPSVSKSMSFGIDSDIEIIDSDDGMDNTLKRKADEAPSSSEPKTKHPRTDEPKLANGDLSSESDKKSNENEKDYVDMDTDEDEKAAGENDQTQSKSSSKNDKQEEPESKTISKEDTKEETESNSCSKGDEVEKMEIKNVDKEDDSNLGDSNETSSDELGKGENSVEDNVETKGSDEKDTCDQKLEDDGLNNETDKSQDDGDEEIDQIEKVDEEKSNEMNIPEDADSKEGSLSGGKINESVEKEVLDDLGESSNDNISLAEDEERALLEESTPADEESAGKTDLPEKASEDEITKDSEGDSAMKDLVDEVTTTVSTDI